MTNQVVSRSALIAGALVVAVLCVPIAGALAQNAESSLSDLPDAGVILRIPAADAAKIDPSVLATNGQRLVLTLAASASQRDALRQKVNTAGLAGLVTVIEQSSLRRLPMASSYVNALVVEDPADAQRRGLSWAEAVRVVAPGGRLWIRGGSAEAVAQELKKAGSAERVRIEDPRDGWLPVLGLVLPGMGEWRHTGVADYGKGAADAGNRLAATDTMNPRRNAHTSHEYYGGYAVGDELRDPVWLRWLDAANHPGIQKCSGGLTAVDGLVVGMYSGENFAFFRDGLLFKRQSFLACRDAFNGMLRWARLMPQHSYFYGMSGGRAIISADGGGYVYMIGLNAADGAEVYRFKPNGGIRTVRIGDVLGISTFSGKEKSAHISAYAVADGKSLWKREIPWTQFVMADGMLYSSVSESAPNSARENSMRVEIPAEGLVAFDVLTGVERWRVAFTDWPAATNRTLQSAGEGVVVLHTENRVEIADGKTGKLRHRMPIDWVKRAYVSLLPQSQLVIADNTTRFVNLVDGTTTVVSTNIVRPPKGIATWCCGQGRMTAGMYQALAEGRKTTAPPEVGSLATSGTCISGPALAYHTVYMHNQGCICFSALGRMRGFVAAGSIDPMPTSDDFREAGPLEKGVAFARPAPPAVGGPSGWTMARGNPGRSAATAETIGGSPQTRWTTKAIPQGLGSNQIARYVWRANFLYSTTLTSPVANDSLLICASPMSHEVVALSASTGKLLWRFEADGPIDSAPSMVRGRCVFGCRDGYLYSLDIKDGALAWRRRLSPVPQRINVYGQLEDRCPVIGAVTLDKDGNVWATAGLNGQQRVIVAQVDALTGAVRDFTELPRGNYSNDMLVEDEKGGLWLNYQPANAPRSAPPPKYNERGLYERLPFLSSPDSELISPARVVTPFGPNRTGDKGFWSSNRYPPGGGPSWAHMSYRGLTATFWAWDSQRAIGVEPLYTSREAVANSVRAVSRGKKWPVADNGLLYALDRVKLDSLTTSKNPDVRDALLWQTDVGEVWALAIAGDKIVAGGPVYPNAPPATSEGPAVLGRPADKPVSIDPLYAKGRLHLLNAADGKRLTTLDLPSTPVHDGCRRRWQGVCGVRGRQCGLPGVMKGQRR